MIYFTILLFLLKNFNIRFLNKNIIKNLLSRYALINLPPPKHICQKFA